MLKSNPARQIRRLLPAFFFLVILFLFHDGQAQQTAPLKSRPKKEAIIELTFDEYGRMLNQPVGFSLLEGSKYGFNVTVRAPKKQHAALRKYFRESLESLKEKLDDPSTTEAKLWSLLLGSGDELKKYIQELDDLVKIIAKDDATAISDLTAKAAGSDFDYLPKARIISESLYGNTFTVTANGAFVTAKYDQDISIPIPAASYPINQTNLLVKIEDLKKRFLADYFNKTYPDIKADIDALKPGIFYQNDVENGIKELASAREALIEGMKKLDPANLKVLCDYAVFTDKYPKNDLIKFLTKHPKWFLSWAWYTGGEIRLNPLDFTEVSRLRLHEGHDTVKAANMENYITVSMKRMEDPKTELKISVGEYDSLNRKLDKVKEMYSYAAENEQLKKKNKQALAKSQQIKRTIDSLSFRVVPKDDRTIYFIKTYDAANSLQPAAGTKIQALPLSKEVEIVVYNVKSTESVSVSPEFKDTPDQSLAMEQLNKAGDLGTGLLEQAAKAAPIVAALSKAIFSSPANLVRVELPELTQKKEITRGPASVPESSKSWSNKNGISQYTMDFVADSTTLEIMLVFSDKKNIDEYDFWAEVEEALMKKNSYCKTIVDRVARELFAGLKSYNTNFSSRFADYKKYRNAKVEEYRVRISDLTAKAVDEYAKEVQASLNTDFSLLTVAHAMLKSKTYILPPKDIKVQDDPAAPAYSNTYESVAMQESSKMVTIPLVLSNKADGKVLTKRTDTYKVSQPHWIMASLGLSYAFGEFRRNEAEVKDGRIVNAPDEEQRRLVAGFHIYPNPILLTDNRFIGRIGKQWTSRLSFFLGASFPKPLYNPQIGMSVDPWPGVKATYGWHFYRKTYQTIVNDQIQKEDSKYIYNSPFVSLSIEPVSFVKLIGLIK